MFSVLKSRFIQGFRTGKYPCKEAPALPPRFQGRPVIDQEKCRPFREKLCEICPVSALEVKEDKLVLDMGKCLFCGRCSKVADGIVFSKDYALSAIKRENLFVAEGDPLPENIANKFFRKFCKRSLKIRQVSAGGCAACELDFNVLNTLAWDMGRFGIQVVASPRHADCILVTGPVTENMRLALEKTFAAMPNPSFVILCGACGISGGIYKDNAQCHGGGENLLKADLYIPGCPPHPAVILEGLLYLMGRSTKILKKQRAGK